MQRPMTPLQMIMTAAKTVSRASAAVGAAGEHHRDDQRDLDHGDREREDQRAERLADPVRDHFGVMDGGEHRGDQQDRFRCDHGGNHDRAIRAGCPGCCQHNPGQQGPYPGPPRHPSPHPTSLPHARLHNAGLHPGLTRPASRLQSDSAAMFL